MGFYVYKFWFCKISALDSGVWTGGARVTLDLGGSEKRTERETDNLLQTINWHSLIWKAQVST